MKPIITYSFYLCLLLSLTVTLNRFFSTVCDVNQGFLFLLIKTYVLTDAIACLSLLVFYLKSTYESSLKIILICTACFLLVSFFGFLGSYLTMWYSNIPEEIIMFQQNGLLVNGVNILAAFVTSFVTATVLILTKAKNH